MKPTPRSRIMAFMDIQRDGDLSGARENRECLGEWSGPGIPVHVFESNVVPFYVPGFQGLELLQAAGDLSIEVL